jgi:type IV pilus assembly protein PilA
MANYFFLGADGKEYGPVSAEQIRQWRADNRANAQSQVRSTEGGGFVPLGSVPELEAGGSLPPTPTPMSAYAPAAAPGGEQETIKSLAATLASSSGWMRFFAIMMYIAGGLYVLTIWGVLIAWAPIWLGVIVWRAATRADAARASGRKEDLNGALDSVRLYYKLMGILSIGVLLIIPVIGLLAAMAIPAFTKVRQQARIKAISNNLRQFANASQEYMLEQHVTQTSYTDIVGDGTDKLIRNLRPVVDENYTTLQMTKSATQLSITSTVVGNVTYSL